MNSTEALRIDPLRVRLLRPALAALLAAAGAVHAADIPLFNTGVDATGSVLGGAALDPHWNLVDGPGITAAAPAVVVNNQHPFGLYFETSDSRWIWVEAGGSVSPGGPYTFRLQFDLTGLDPATAQVGGSWGIDDTGGQIRLNGDIPAGTGLSLLPLSFDNFNTLHPFSITGGFVAGVNSLDITVTDVSNPGALNVTAISGTAELAGVTPAVPEPSNVAMLGCGLLALLGVRGLRRRSKA